MLSTMMRAYKLLHDADAARPHVLFPLGVVQMTAANNQDAIVFNRGLVSAMRREFQPWADPLTPVLVYEQLGAEWTSDPPGERFKAYLLAVETAVAAVTAAGVAMLDLRPANVMWRSLVDDSVEILLIDFEYVLPEGYLIPADLVEAQSADARYDITKYAKRGNDYYASTQINRHWLEFMRRWAANSAGLSAHRGASAFSPKATQTAAAAGCGGGSGGGGGGDTADATS